jgi:predicted DNA-binding protein
MRYGRYTMGWNVYVEKELKDKLQEESEKQRRSISEISREAFEKGLAEDEKKIGGNRV